jgi:hypothetical protein
VHGEEELIDTMDVCLVALEHDWDSTPLYSICRICGLELWKREGSTIAFDRMLAALAKKGSDLHDLYVSACPGPKR